MGKRNGYQEAINSASQKSKEIILQMQEAVKPNNS